MGKKKKFISKTIIMFTVFFVFCFMSSQPAQAIGDSNTRLSSGLYHVLYIDGYGTLYAAGSNGYGQLGTGKYTTYDDEGNSIDDK